MNPQTVTLRGRRYRIRWGCRLTGKYADIDPPSVKNPTIRFARNIPKDKLLEIIIHECGHGCLWDIEEKAIAQTARDTARLLKRLRFTRSAP